MNTIRVLIVDDSFLMRKIISDILQTSPAITVVGEAQDGIQALQKIKDLQPDVVTLDIEMPRMNGIEALRDIVSQPHHPSVVMVSGFAQEGVDITLECLAMGAADFIVKPSGSFSLDLDTVKDVLLAKVTAAAAADTTRLPQRVQQPSKQWHYTTTGGVVIIGASTGGPAALDVILPELPAHFPYPIVVAQHLPGSFTASFTARLQRSCQLPVSSIEDGMPVEPGCMYIAAGGATTTIAVRNETPIFVVKPNATDIETPPISPLMESAVAVYGAMTIGVILTGMGTDGLVGMQRIKEAGGATIVQDESTSAVFGMGGAVVEKGIAEVVVPLDQIIEKIHEALAGNG